MAERRLLFLMLTPFGEVTINVMEDKVNMENNTAEITGTEIKSRVGETAGQVWNTLTTDGAMTLTQLKKKLNGQGEMLGYALGWLAREDKIDMVLQKKTLRLQLK
jgi:Winged helix-turn-helix domain (DUF2582)